MEAPHYETAEQCINETVPSDGNGSPGTFLDTLQTNSEMLESSEKAQVQTYITVTRDALHGMTIQPLDPHVGGVYDGTHITMATSTLMVGETVGSSLDRIVETAEHEKYHQDNDHLAPMILGASAKGGEVVTIGGEEFSDTRMVEALTVHDTGMEFVSSEYIEHERRVSSALIRASLGWDSVRKAINHRKDYGVLDDESRLQPAEADHMMVA